MNRSDYYTDGPCVGQLIPGTPTWRRLQDAYSELAREQCRPEPKGYRMIEDCNGFPMPIYDAPPIRTY